MVSTRYSQVNALRTIEDILGTRAHQPEHRVPAADDRRLRHPLLGRVELHRRGLDRAGGDRAGAGAGRPGREVRHAARSSSPSTSAQYWAKVTAGFDFSDADRVPPAKFNRLLWKGLMGKKPYPAVRGTSSGTKRDDD